MTALPRIFAIPIVLTACVGIGVAVAQTTAAKSWPTRVVRIVLPGSPGAGSDIIGRVLAQPLTKSLGQNFIIDNRPGAANIIGNSPEEFSAQIRDGREKWAKVARDAGIKPE